MTTTDIWTIIIVLVSFAIPILTMVWGNWFWKKMTKEWDKNK